MYCFVCFFTCLLELIDTLWNVNTEEQKILLGKTFELIDTLWNVNKDGDIIRLQFTLN